MTKATVKRGDIFFCELREWPNSDVQTGRRPVLVISNNIGNYYSNIVTVAPITTKLKDFPTHYDVYLGETHSQVLLEQIVTVPKDSLFSFKCRLSDTQMEEVNEVILTALGIIPTIVSSAKERIEQARKAKEDLAEMQKALSIAQQTLILLDKYTKRWKDLKPEVESVAEGKRTEPSKLDGFEPVKVSRKRGSKGRTDSEIESLLRDYEAKVPVKELMEKYGYKTVEALRSSVFYFRKKRSS